MSHILLLAGVALFAFSTYLTTQYNKDRANKDWKPGRFFALYADFFLIAAATLYHSTVMLLVISFFTASDISIIILEVYKEHLRKRKNFIQYFESKEGREIAKFLDEHKERNYKSKDVDRVFQDFYEEKAKKEREFDSTKGGDNNK